MKSTLPVVRGVFAWAALACSWHCLDAECAEGNSVCSGSSAALFLAQAPPASERRLMDSGQTQCYDPAHAPVSCAALAPGAVGYGQDAHYSNTPALRDLRDKGDETTDDPRAGLQWTRCSLGTGAALLFGLSCDNGVGATPAVYTQANARNACEALEHAGHSDWRLPEIHELLRLVDASPAAGPLIDAALFPNTSGLGYNSATLDPITTNAYFQLRADDGAVALNSVFTSAYVRCVRGAISNYGPYWTRGNGAVLDLASGLYWQSCARGQTGDQCETGAPIASTWLEALDTCETMQWAGRDDWRLPSYAELNSLVRFTESGVRMDASAFPAAGFTAWTSTTNPDTPDQAGIVDFAAGVGGNAPKADGYAVRCVAGP